MLGAHASTGADWGPHHHWHLGLTAGHVAELGRMIDDLVHGDRHKIGELKLDHRPRSDQGAADPGTGDGRFRDRCVHHALWTKRFEQPLSYLKKPADRSHVLAQDINGPVTLHFFTQRFSYAVHALAYVAKKPRGQLATLPELAGWMKTIWTSASESYLSNVLQRLARGGLLRSHRGVCGGYSLAKPADQINLRIMVELLEGVELDQCALSMDNECLSHANCPIQEQLRNLSEAYLESLAQVNIAELSQAIEIAPPSDASVS